MLLYSNFFMYLKSVQSSFFIFFLKQQISHAESFYLNSIIITWVPLFSPEDGILSFLKVGKWNSVSIKNC